MQITLQSITLENFKGIRFLRVDLLPGQNTIKGKNRTGKTTIVDAILWCLFGKDSKNRSQFGIKTRDASGREIYDLKHTVSIDVLFGDRNITLTRSLIEKWEKVHGTTDRRLRGNITEYYINGTKVNAKDYQAAIGSYMSEDLFRTLTSPSAFTSMSWEEQRAILSPLAGNITMEAILNVARQRFQHSEALDDVTAMLKNDTIETIRKNLAYKIRTINNDIDDIPIRMDEVRKGMPAPSPEWADLEKNKAENERQIQSLRDAIKVGKANPKLDSLYKKHDFLRRRAENIEQSALDKANRGKMLIEDERRDTQNHIDDMQRLIKSARANMEMNAKLRDRCKKQKEECEVKADEIRRLWNENAKRKFSITESDTVCPTCHQPLPESLLQENIARMKAVFLDKKAECFRELTERANELKKFMAQIDEQDSHYEKENDDALANIDSLNLQIRKHNEQLDAISQKTAPTQAEILQEDDNYQDILHQLALLQKEMAEAAAETDNSEDIKESLKALEEQKEFFITEEQRKNLYDATQARLTELQSDQASLNKQLSELELRLDAANIIMTVSNEIFEQRINECFSMVKFRMFKTQINGERIPFCEAMVDGVPFADLNTAAKINAGIDIINSLSEYHQSYAPVVIDNAEAVNQLLTIKSQSIALYVTEDPVLTINGAQCAHRLC